MSELNPEFYRRSLANDLKSIDDHGERAKALESESGSWRYITAQEKHLISVAEHPEKMRLKRLEEIAYEKTLAPRISDSVSEATKQIEEDGRPFPERESYYSRSSHCDWGGNYGYHRWLGRSGDGRDGLDKVRSSLRHLGDKFPEWKQLDVLLQKFALMGYVLSATSDEIDYDKNPDKWFHYPLSGANTTLGDYLGNDFRTVDFTESENPFTSDEKIKDIATKIDGVLKKLSDALIRNDRGFGIGYVREKREAILPEIIQLRDELKELGLSLAKDISGLLDTVAKRLEEEEAELKKEE